MMSNSKKVRSRSYIRKNLSKNWPLYTMLLPGLALIFVFNYIPMYGIIMAFQNFKPAIGFFGSPIARPWYRYFQQVFTDYYFYDVFKNTLALGFRILLTFPAPIFLALMFNELRFPRYKRVMQTVSYMPHFVSTVIVVGIMKLLFASDGPLANILDVFGIDMVNPFLLNSAFYKLYIGSGLWAGLGFSSIIYLASIAGINTTIYDAANIDGANRYQKIWYITLPSILPTIVILFIFSVPGVIGGGDTTKVLLIQTDATRSISETLGTYTYRVGIAGNMRSYAAAAGLFTTVISFALLVATNYISRKVNDISLW